MPERNVRLPDETTIKELLLQPSEASLIIQLQQLQLPHTFFNIVERGETSWLVVVGVFCKTEPRLGFIVVDNSPQIWIAKWDPQKNVTHEVAEFNDFLLKNIAHLKYSGSFDCQRQYFGYL